MASAIDPTLPVQGSPTTASVRANFSAAKSEIEALQATAGVGPQGPIGNTGPSGTLTVGTVTTGAAGTNATVTNSGSTTAAVFNFTIPRGDAGTGGGGITETQAKDAVRQGNVRFEESPETTAAAWATTPNLAQAPVVGANWTPATGGTATSTYTHDTGSTSTLAYPTTISNGNFYQIVFTMSNVAATSTATGSFFTLYFRNGPTTTTGQQTVLASVGAGTTIVIQATANFTHFVVVPVSGWQGTFTLTRIVVGGTQNSGSLSLKDWAIRVRGNSQFDGGGGRFSTSGSGTAFGFNALNALTTGSNNIAFGENALSRNTTGGSNIGVGQNAMSNTLTGTSNVAVGNSAMSSNQTGGSNVAVGAGALSNSQNGNSSVAVGASALNGIVTGQYNVAIGASTLMHTTFGGDTTSSNNIAIGYITMWNPPHGSDNIGIGQFALAGGGGPPASIAISNVIAIGAQAGRYSGTTTNFLTSASNSLFLGASSRAGGNSQNNQIVIGHNSAGHGSNTITLGNDEITHLHCHVQTISALSDSRVKENIQAANLDNCLSAVKNLPVSEWDWLPIAGPHPDKHDIGFVSDDVAKVFPKAISKEDRSLTIRDAEGKPEMTSVVEPIWYPPDQEPDAAAPRTQTRQIEKTVEIKGLQYVSTTEMLPTLWGAVQQLIQRIEELEKQPTDPASNPSSGADPAPKRGLFRK